MNSRPGFPSKFASFRNWLMAVGVAGWLLTGGQLKAAELIADDKFSDSGMSWTLQTSPGATATMNVEQDNGEAALVVDAQKSSETTDDVRVYRTFGDIEQGKDYEVTFKAKATAPTTIIPYIYPEGGGARVLFRVEAKVDGDWKEYHYTFKGKNTESNCQFGFSHLGTVENKYYFKDVVLTVAD